jgi:hypothetical protein
MWHGVSYEYEKMSPEDRRKFDEWIGANAILSAVCAVGILAMAFAGFSSLGRSDAVIAARPCTHKIRSNVCSSPKATELPRDGGMTRSADIVAKVF